MSRHCWTETDRLPLPMEQCFTEDGPAFISRRVLLQFPDGNQAVGRAELVGDWTARVDGATCDYIGAVDAAWVIWSCEDSLVHGKDPSHWIDLPEAPRISTGHAIVFDRIPLESFGSGECVSGEPNSTCWCQKCKERPDNP